MSFTEAKRYKTKLRLALIAPSGGGKTHSALIIANGLANGNKIAVIDSERGKALLEAGKDGIPSYYHDEINPPYSPDKYISKIMEGADLVGPDGVLVVDSISHEWQGDGGILDMHGKAEEEQSHKNTWAAWRMVTPKQNSFIDTIICANCHIIVTMRAKTAWEVQVNGSGQKVPVKIGLAPIQKSDIEYEFTAALSLHQVSHAASCLRDSTGIFDGKIFIPTVETGNELRLWLTEGEVNNNEQYVPKHIESKNILSKLDKDVRLIETAEEVNEWGRKNSELFDLMTKEDSAKAVEICREHYAKLLPVPPGE